MVLCGLFFFKKIFIYLAAPGLSSSIGSNSLTRNQTRAPCIGNMES